MHEVLLVRPRSVALYELAFTHASLRGVEGYLPEETNERLEFLGDSVIELIVTEYLYENFPTLSEGHLTWMRSRVISRESMNSFSESLSLSSYVMAAPGALQSAKHCAGNTLEALFGALYLDVGLVQTTAVFRRLVLDAQVDWDDLLRNPVDHKSRLFQWSQEFGHNLSISCRRVAADTPRFLATIALDGEFCVTAFGDSKKRAEGEAARLFLEQRGIN